jgi:hypothetical protein
MIVRHERSILDINDAEARALLLSIDPLAQDLSKKGVFRTGL